MFKEAKAINIVHDARFALEFSAHALSKGTWEYLEGISDAYRRIIPILKAANRQITSELIERQAIGNKISSQAYAVRFLASVKAHWATWQPLDGTTLHTLAREILDRRHAQVLTYALLSYAFEFGERFISGIGHMHADGTGFQETNLASTLAKQASDASKEVASTAKSLYIAECVNGQIITSSRELFYREQVLSK